ncbi:MAG: hypothetical protein ACXWLD_08740 [Rhizomicrobium sp.]
MCDKRNWKRLCDKRNWKRIVQRVVGTSAVMAMPPIWNYPQWRAFVSLTRRIQTRKPFRPGAWEKTKPGDVCSGSKPDVGAFAHCAIVSQPEEGTEDGQAPINP